MTLGSFQVCPQFCKAAISMTTLQQPQTGYRLNKPAHFYQTIPKSEYVMTAYEVTLSYGKELIRVSSDNDRLSSKYLRTKDVVVCIRRKLRCSHLDPNRFQIITQCATEAINNYTKYEVSDKVTTRLLRNYNTPSQVSPKMYVYSWCDTEIERIWCLHHLLQ